MTDRERVIVTKLAVAGEATTAGMIGWLGCDDRSARLCLGIMARCRTIIRVAEGSQTWRLGFSPP